MTSSSCVAGGALTGLGFGPQAVARVIGVAKAYTTRVSAGPFPTELTDAVGGHIREAGGEYGTTTGRPRRCGWLDLPILRYAAQVNGLTELALTKLDVLTGIHPLRVAVAYERDGERIARFPGEWGAEEVARWQPVYEELPGWDEEIRSARRWEDPASGGAGLRGTDRRRGRRAGYADRSRTGAGGGGESSGVSRQGLGVSRQGLGVSRQGLGVSRQGLGVSRQGSVVGGQWSAVGGLSMTGFARPAAAPAIDGRRRHWGAQLAG